MAAEEDQKAFLRFRAFKDSYSSGCWQPGWGRKPKGSRGTKHPNSSCFLEKDKRKCCQW